MPEPTLTQSLTATPDLAAAAAILLPAMAYLMIKHFAADFVLQSERQMREKGIYGAAGGFIHAATHGLLTAPVFLLLPAISAALAAAILIAECVVHYHIDWTKEQVVRRAGWTADEAPFWWALGLDQLLHGLTYVCIIWLIVGSA